MTIGGGSGQFALLSGLRDLHQFEVTAVVSMVDSGGSTGRLRDEMGILPPGDVLKCILALSPDREAARSILLKKFTTDRRLRGHNAGNMLLTMLSRYTGSFPAGMQSLAEILSVRGRILPVTIDRATLVAELTDGTRIYGENAIDVPRGHQREKIKNVFLVPHHSDSISVYPPVIDAINRADYIVIGPGDLFTSIIPGLIVPGVTEALRSTSAKLLYVINIMTKYGETHQYSGSAFVRRLEEVIQRNVDGVLCNTKKPEPQILKEYRRQKAEFVKIDASRDFWGGRRLFCGDLLDTSGGIVRHDSQKLADMLVGIIGQNRIQELKVKKRF